MYLTPETLDQQFVEVAQIAVVPERRDRRAVGGDTECDPKPGRVEHASEPQHDRDDDHRQIDRAEQHAAGHDALARRLLRRSARSLANVNSRSRNSSRLGISSLDMR